MQNQINKLPDDEIDFGMIRSRIWTFIIYPIKLLLQNLVITLAFIFVAIIVSISLKYIIPKSYSATFIIRPVEKNEKIHIRILGDIQLLWKLDDTKSLARELKLDESIVSSIDKIAVTNYYFAKNKADSSNLTSIELKVSDNKILVPIQNAILNYLEENPYFKKIKDLNKKSISLRTNLIDKDILLLDSLKKLQLSSYDKLKITEQNSVLLKDVINPTSTYTLSLERMNQKTGLLYQSEFIDNFQLVKGVVVSEQHIWPPRILYIGLVIGPLFLLFCFIYLHLKSRRYKKQ